jgi:hypothetical protein
MRVDHSGQLVDSSNIYIKPNMVNDPQKTKSSKAMPNEWTKVVAPPSKHTVPASTKKTKAKKSKPKQAEEKSKVETKKTKTNKSKEKPKDTSSDAKKKSKDEPASEKKDTFKDEDTKRQSTKRQIKVGHKTVEIEQPPKTLLLIWALVSAELALDLVTTGIAFSAFLSAPGTCCGDSINNGPLPLVTTIPFFFLVIAELVFLLRAIMLTLFPSWMMNQAAEVDPEDQKKYCFCGCKWTPKYMMWLVNFLTVINPFFGFAIAWQLMYQSDITEALTVMGLELVTIILHFLSVYLEKAATTWKLKLMHSIIIIPWLATLGINVWYINRGGVCYDTLLETFWYKGCEVCPSGMRPVNGTLCPTTTLVDGVNQTTYESYQIWDLDSETNCDADALTCWFPYS